MSLSKKKYSFHKKRSVKKENIIINQPLYTTIEDNDIKENKYLDLNQKIDIDDLIYQTNTKEEENKEIVNNINLLDIKSIDESEKNEKEHLTSNPDLQYLINQNKVENIDFIKTLLKLKGISIDSEKSYKSSKNVNYNFIHNFEEENDFAPKSSKTNSNLILNNKYKSIPSNCSTSTSKINTINYNYHNNENEDEENLKNLEFTFSTKENNNNLNNINNNINNNNIIKTEQNTLLEDITLDNNEKEKIHSINNKETISSESNTNKIGNKNSNEIMNSKKKYIDIKYSDNFNNKNIIKIFYDKNSEINKKNKNRAIITNNRENNNKSFNKRNINDKNIQNLKNIEIKEGKMHISKEKKIIIKKSINKKIPFNKNKTNEKNNFNNEKNNSKEKKSKSKSKRCHIIKTETKHKREFKK